MDLLITASIGIFETQNKFYLQIISAEKEGFYYCEMTRECALLFSNKERVIIEFVDELPDGFILEAPISPS